MSKLYRVSDEDFMKLVSQSDSWSAVLKACGYKTLSHNLELAKRRVLELGISTKHFNQNGRSPKRRTSAEIFREDADDIYQSVLKAAYTRGNYTPYKCAICGQEPWWNGKELVLTLDHINGHNHDNRLENLRWVCPNCDRQLETYAGRNPITARSRSFKPLGGEGNKPQKVMQIDPETGKVIKVWPSIESVRKTFNFDGSWLTRATQHPEKYKAGGFIWKRVDLTEL